MYRAECGRREHLDDVGAGVPGVEDFGRREAAGHDRDVAAVAGLDDLAPEHRADDVLRAGVDDLERRVGVDHGAGAEEEAGRQRRRQLAISSIAPGTVIVTSSARTPPSAIASTTRGACRVLHPDDGDDAGLLDRLRRDVSIRGASFVGLVDS